MTNHIHGPDSYVECDRYNVVSQNQRDHSTTECYCGANATNVARVGFHTDTTEETLGDWPSSYTRVLKAHRCDEHKFEEDNS